MKRREAIKKSAMVLGAATLAPSIIGCDAKKNNPEEMSDISDSVGGEPFKISLAQWSHHRGFFGRDGVEKLNPSNFALIARSYGIEAIEYVNAFYQDVVGNQAYFNDLKRMADSEGVKSLLIMCDGEGRLGDPDEAARKQAVQNHHKWVDIAKFLGCHSIRVNAASEGEYAEQMKLAADGLSQLAEYGDLNGLNVIVENHGGLSSNGEWLSGVMKMANHPRVGTLPDFGNFNISNEEKYDRYKGVTELMPFAKAVSAKSHEFGLDGNEINTDYFRMMDIVLEAGYHGYVGIEYEGSLLRERDGIWATKRLLERVAERG